MGEVEQQGAVHRAPGSPTAHGKGGDGVAVVALPAPDEFELTGVASLPVVLVGDLKGRFVCFRPT